MEWEEIRYLIPHFLANPALSLRGENSATWVEITPGNVILCTLLKRHPLSANFHSNQIQGIKSEGGELKRWPYRGSAFWNFFLTIQATFFVMESSESVLPLCKHKTIRPSLCCTQPTTPPSVMVETRAQKSQGGVKVLALPFISWTASRRIT